MNMLTSEELVDSIKSRIGKLKVVKLTEILQKEQFSVHDLIDITFSENRDIAFRAAWLLENLFLQKPAAYIDEIEYLVSRIKDVKHPSCKRHYAKIMMHVTAAKAPEAIRKKLEAIDLEPVVEQFFDWLIDAKVLVAVKVFAVGALFNVRSRYPWMAGELKDQIQFMLRDGTAAMQSRGRKLLAQL
ncbi:hypothetical protein [Mucilaginibacter ginsenosidivorans]|uniref:Adenylosuccinate lyase n=1 Tax=Mucilaginibacter ginsenosidivorans TaxID=398053 RepID=A0A5B8V1L4_9SPHI|nr:hypothetical protein [Mucilaginibacter ginsenosidivorans]QEC64693.1 hypothetical protein FRZ54_19700 [Mucilaginibacter ginsenosidivorans]